LLFFYFILFSFIFFFIFIFHSDLFISVEVALKVLPTSGAILEETLASTIKHTKAIATYFILSL